MNRKRPQNLCFSKRDRDRFRHHPYFKMRTGSQAQNKALYSGTEPCFVSGTERMCRSGFSGAFAKNQPQRRQSRQQESEGAWLRNGSLRNTYRPHFTDRLAVSWLARRVLGSLGGKVAYLHLAILAVRSEQSQIQRPRPRSWSRIGPGQVGNAGIVGRCHLRRGLACHSAGEDPVGRLEVAAGDKAREVVDRKEAAPLYDLIVGQIHLVGPGIVPGAVVGDRLQFRNDVGPARAHRKKRKAADGARSY